jgi:murein DD-endopeptidase MepM/ murein hydrolase activator NlpD
VSRALKILAVLSFIGSVAPTDAADSTRVSLRSPETIHQGESITLVARSPDPDCRLRVRSPLDRRDERPITLPSRRSLITFTVAVRARRGTWRVKLTCDGSSSRARLRVIGKRGRASAPLIAANTLEIYPARDLEEDAIPPSLESDDDKDSGGPFPDFRVPFPCGEVWAASTYRNHGNAVDWNTRRDNGRPVVASADGVVHLLPFGRPNGGYGNTVVIDHGADWSTVYAHLRSYAVREGESVTRGQLIGSVGRTGNATGPHLHYEQRRGNKVQPTMLAGLPVHYGPTRSDNCSFEPEPPPPATDVRRVVITVDNRVTNGATMREDTTPARLTTQPWVYCGRRGCNIDGTERTSGETYDAAICQTVGERTTNGNDSDPADDQNPERFQSTLYYGVLLSNGTFGYVSEVWIRSEFRGGLGLRAC